MATDLLSGDYHNFLQALKERIRNAQIRSALAVNRELVTLYWQIGQEILTRQQEQGWGAKVISQLAKDLKAAFPEMKGFSRTNLLYMRLFAEAYPDGQIVQQLAGQIPVRQAWPLTWRWKSSTQPDGSEGLAKCKGNIVRCCLKEASSKSTGRRTETGYQAGLSGRVGWRPQSPYPSRGSHVNPAVVWRRWLVLPWEVCSKAVCCSMGV